MHEETQQSDVVGRTGRRRALRFGRGTALVVGGVVAGALVAGGVAVATIPSSTGGTVSACVKTIGGAVRVIDFQAGKRCTTSEKLVQWSRLVSRGAYSSTASYKAGDIVQSGGSTYLAKAASKGKPVSSATSWTLLAAKGATGAQGPAGPAGPAGTPADTSTFYTKTQVDAKFASTVRVNISGAAFVGTGGDVVTEVNGCYRNTTAARVIQASVDLPVGAVITKVYGWMVDGGADDATMDLRRTTGTTNVLTTVTGTGSGIAEYSSTLGTPEPVNSGDYFTLRWSAPDTTSTYQICGAGVEYTVPAGTSLS